MEMISGKSRLIKNKAKIDGLLFEIIRQSCLD